MTVTWLADRAIKFLYGVLEPDATLRTALGGAGRVYDTDEPQIPAGQTEPARYVVIASHSGLPIRCLGPTRPGEDFIIAVKAVALGGPFSSLLAALDRIDALLFPVGGLDVTTGGYRYQVYDTDTFSAIRYATPTPGGPVERGAGRLWGVSVYPAA